MAVSLRLVHRMRRNFRRERVFRDRLNPLDMYNDDELFRRFRLPRRELLELIDTFAEDLDYVIDRKGSLPASMQMLIALRFFATGSFQEVIADTFGVSKGTVCTVIYKVSAVLVASMERFVKFDRQETTEATKRKFFDMNGFAGVIGCIDCTHVKIIAPSEYEGIFVNRKGYHSINVQLICDADMKILNVVASDPGSFHDAKILRESAVFTAFEDPNGPPLIGHLLGDSGYMLRPWLLTPYINPRGRTQEKFNFAHSSTRTMIERCNGVLKRRWHCLHGELRYSPDKACRIIGACVVLHNICLRLPLPQNCCNAGCVHDDHDNTPVHACQQGRPQPRHLVQEGNAAAVRNTFADAYFGR